MRFDKVVIAALALVLAAPAILDAQVAVRAPSRGMLGIMTESVPAGTGARSQRRVVVDVVPGAPAQRAGIVVGDTILTINGAPATQQVMDTGFEPGQAVELRVRRNGRERTVSIVAAARGAFTNIPEMLPDSMLGRMSVIMRAVRADADTLALTARNIVIGRDSAFAYTMRGDSMRVFRWSGSLEPAHIDSLRTRVYRMQEDWPRMLSDSMVIRYEAANANVFRFDRDSIIDTTRPAQIFASSYGIGMRAVAGAELSELNAELAQYFGATGGVLVLNARDDTPAARAGLRAGDVILRAGTQDVSTIMELRRAIDTAPRGAPVPLQVLRRGQTLTITLGQQR
jgi:predicted metalloprotease with PDZ domain